MLCENFKYPKLLKYFEEISAVPRPSFYEDKAVEYLVDFAKKRNLDYYVDDAKNVLINIPATEGCEDREPLLLQGHTDMVCEKNIGCEHDFMTEGLDLYVEDGYIHARGTTLGGDDGIAVAAMLAVIDGEVERHPACQCLFTAAEEPGLVGIKDFDFSRIYARKMLNMDNAEEDILVAGCAGGLRTAAIFDIERVPSRYKKRIEIKLGGLMGGHSGENMKDKRANSIKIAGKLLEILYDSVDLEIVSLDGGTKENAIPREFVMVLASNDIRHIAMTAEQFAAEVKVGLTEDDKDFFIECRECTSDGEVFSSRSAISVIRYINGLDCGILKMSDDIEGLVEFSRNMGVARTVGDKVEFLVHSRSAIQAQLDEAYEVEKKAAEQSGGRFEFNSIYPGWEYDPNSALAARYLAAAEKIGLDVKITALHAGLEAAIVKKEVPDMDIVCCGPNNDNLHSPMERLEIASFARFFDIVKDIVENG